MGQRRRRISPPAASATPTSANVVGSGTEGLAPMIVDELFELMAGLARDSITIVLVEQNVQRAIALTQRYYLIERGQVTAQGESANAAHRADLLEKLSV